MFYHNALTKEKVDGNGKRKRHQLGKKVCRPA